MDGAVLKFLASLDPTLAAVYIFIVVLLPSVGFAFRFLWQVRRQSGTSAQERADQQQQLIETQRNSLTDQLYKELDRANQRVRKAEAEVEVKNGEIDAITDIARGWRDRAFYLKDIYERALRNVGTMLKLNPEADVEWPEEVLPAFHDIVQDNIRLNQEKAR